MGSETGGSEVRRVRELRRDAAARDAEGVFVIEGERMLRDAVEAGIEVEALYVARGEPAPAWFAGRVVEVAPRIHASLGDTVSGTTVIAVARRPELRRGERGFAVVLDSIADPGNVGTLIRSAEAAGADVVWLVGPCADHWAPKVVRASAGAVFLVPVERTSWEQVGEGRGVIGLTSAGGDGTIELGDLEPGRHWPTGSPVAVVVGHETRGVDPAAPVGLWVTIAHRGRVESLNAAMAGTVAFMHIGRLLASDPGK